MKVDFRKKFQWREALTFAMFVVLAALIWYGHAMQSTRDTRVPVYIQYTGINGSIAFGEELPDVVMVEIRDAGRQLGLYHREPLRLSINLRTYIHGDKGTLHIPSDALRHSVTDLLQSTSQLVEIVPEEITCEYYTEQEKTVPIAMSPEWSPAAEYQPVGAPTLEKTKVKIFGSTKRLEAIDTIYTLPVGCSELMDTTRLRLPLALPEHIRASFDSVDVRIITERFTEKKMRIPIQVNGVPEGYMIRIFPREVEVTVRVGISHFSQVSDEHIRAVCEYTPTAKEKMDVNLVYTNPYITMAWAYPSVIEFLLEQ